MASGVKLPSLEGAVPLENRDPPSKESPICLHNDLPLFDPAFVQTVLSNDPPSTGPVWLPPHLRQTVFDWARLPDILELPEATQEELISKGLIDDEGKTIEKESTTDGDKWTEVDIDMSTRKYLPRIVIPKEDGKPKAEPIITEETNNDNETPKPPPPLWKSTRKLSYPFVRFWTEEQRKRSEIDRMLAESNLPTCYDKLVIEARRKGIPPPEPPTAEGPFKDELVVNAFNAIAQMAPLSEKVFTSNQGGFGSQDGMDASNLNPSGGTASGTAAAGVPPVAPTIPSGLGNGTKIDGDDYLFLWDCIYPKDNTGRPCYNPKGVYVVRLWAANAWRAIVINDLVPVNSKNECIFPATEQVREIWPMLLSKALYVTLSYSALGSRSGNSFSLCPRENVHPSTCSLACGGVFGFLVQALTGWQPDAPRTLASLALNRQKEESLPAGFNESDDGSHEGEEGEDVSTAALALVRHLMGDGVPCAPLEQFKFDEIYRAQVTAALGRDPFLVDSSKMRKWPRPPDKRKKGGKKKHGGGDLLATLRAAAITRERRVSELRTKIFDALERPRMHAICASAVPPETLEEEGQKKHALKLARRASRRESRKQNDSSKLSSRASTPGTPEFANLMNAGDQQAAALNNNTSGVKFNQLVGENGNLNNSQTESDSEFAATSDMNSNVTTLDDEEEEEEDEEEEEEEEVTSNVPISNRFTGAINCVRPIARMKALQTHGPPRYPKNRMNCHIVLGIGLRASSMAIPVVEATDIGKFGGDGTAVMNDRRLGWLRGNIRRDQDLLSANLSPSSGGNSVKLSEKLQSMDALDAASAPEPKLLILWRDPKPYNESGGHHQHNQQQQQNDEGGNVSGGENAEGSGSVDGGQAAAAAAAAQREQSMGIDDGNLPEFSPQHPAMAKGNLRWMTPSTFIRAMGGPQQVSLLQLSTRFHMSPQMQTPAETPVTATPAAQPAGSSKSKSSSSSAAAAAAAAASAPPPLTNTLPKHKSEGPKVTAELAGSSTLLTLRHHCDPKTRKPLSDRKPTILRIVTPGSEETDDDFMSDNSVNHVQRMIRLVVSIDVDPNSVAPACTTMVPKLTASGALVPTPGNTGGTTPSAAAAAAAAGSSSVSIASSTSNTDAVPENGEKNDNGDEGSNDRKYSIDENNDDDDIEPPRSMGSLLLRPVTFIAGNPSNDDDEDDDDYGDDPSVKSLETNEKLSPSIDLNNQASSVGSPNHQDDGSVQSGIHDPSNHDNESSPSHRKYLDDDDESILASVHAATLIAWVYDWKPTTTLHPLMTSLGGGNLLEEGSDFGEKSSQEDMNKGSKDAPLILPSGCYQHSVQGMPDGTMLLRLPQSRRKLSYDAEEVGGKNLPFATMTADILLPRLPRQSRSTVDSRGTDTRAYSRDYYFEVISKLPSGGSISFSCSEKMVLGTAQHVWGTSMKNNYSLPSSSKTMSAGAFEKQEAAEKLALKEGWPHARHASGCYPTLPSTVPPCLQFQRDRRGLGNYNENFENFAVLFRYRIKVLPPKHDGSSSAPSSSGGQGIGSGGNDSVNDGMSLNSGAGEEGTTSNFVASNTVLDDMIGPVTECGARLKLYLSNPEARKYVRLVTVGVNASDATKVSMNFPLLETPPLRWRSDAKEGYVVMAILEKPPHINLAPGSWSLVCLSDAPIGKIVSLEKQEFDIEGQAASAIAEAAMASHIQYSSLLPSNKTNNNNNNNNGTSGDNDNNSMATDNKSTSSSLKNKTSKADPPGKLSKRSSVALSSPTANEATSSSTSANNANNEDAPPPIEQMVWKLPNGPMARAHRWGGVYQPNKELRLINDLISGGSTELTIHAAAYPSAKSPISNYALRMRVYQKLKHPKHVTMDGIRPPMLNPRSNFELISDVRGMDHITLELVHVNSSGIIIELSLDERRMKVPSILRSSKSFSTIQLENSFSLEDVTWSSPKWRLMALPSNNVTLQLGPDPTIADWANKLQSKWHEMRLSGSSGGSVSDPLHEPFWLKGNDIELDERKHHDAFIRKKYKTYIDRLKKGIKKSFASSSNPNQGNNGQGSTGGGGSVTQLRQNQWYLDSNLSLSNVPPPPIADRIKEHKELLNMFNEDDRIKSNILIEAVKEGETLVEAQLFALNSMRSKTSDITSNWTEMRNAYRVTAAARKEAVAILLKMAEVAKNLGEGEKGTCIEGDSSSNSKKDDKGKKGKKK
jgi:hypothetical protein